MKADINSIEDLVSLIRSLIDELNSGDDRDRLHSRPSGFWPEAYEDIKGYCDALGVPEAYEPFPESIRPVTHVVMRDGEYDHETPLRRQRNEARERLVSILVYLAGESLPLITHPASSSLSTAAKKGHWELEFGGFHFMEKGKPEKFYSLTGQPLALLRVFVESPRQQTFAMRDFRSAWDDTDRSLVFDEAIRQQLAKLRKKLKQVAADFSIEIAGNDPLPASRGSGGSTWSFLLPRP